MKNIATLKTVFLAAVGLINATIVSSFGGWSTSMKTMLLFMGIDYLTGWMVSAIFHNSTKTEDGRYNSSIGWKGIAKKCVMILLVALAYRVDILLETGTYIFRDGTATAFIVNDAMSIIENARDMGVPIPDVLLNMVSALKDNSKAEKMNIALVPVAVVLGALAFADPVQAAPLANNMVIEWGDVFEQLHPVVDMKHEEAVSVTETEAERHEERHVNVDEATEETTEDAWSDHICAVFGDEIWSEDGNSWTWQCVECGEWMLCEYYEDDEPEEEDEDDLTWTIDEDTQEDDCEESE